MDMNPQVLRGMLRENLADTEKQIQQVNRLASNMRTEPSLVKDERGNFLIIPLLLAKSQTLLALVMLRGE
jgi:hypothetical protein